MCADAKHGITFPCNLEKKPVVFCNASLKNICVFPDPFDSQRWMGYVIRQILQLSVNLFPPEENEQCNGGPFLSQKYFYVEIIDSLVYIVTVHG